MLDNFAAALDGARTMTRVDEIARTFWAVYGEGNINDDDAERVGAHIEAARRRIRPADTVKARAPAVPLASISLFPKRRRRCVSPDRAASRDRRRKLAYSGPLPPALAAGFTTGQLATLRIVADEVRVRGCCVLTLGEIAARAGVGITTARNAIRLAAGDGLLLIVERRRHGAPSLPNVVRIVSREWTAWIAHAGRGKGPKEQTPNGNRAYKKEAQRSRAIAYPHGPLEASSSRGGGLAAEPIRDQEGIPRNSRPYASRGFPSSKGSRV